MSQIKNAISQLEVFECEECGDVGIVAVVNGLIEIETCDCEDL